MEDFKKTKANLLLILGLGLVVLIWQTQTNAKLTVYCAHDSIFAEEVLREFERREGIPVEVKFDSEATKSLGLVERIIRENGRPSCDIFWNNEMLGTLDLARRGLLMEYKGPGWERTPPQWRDDMGLWAGFGGRLRMKIVNTKRADHNEPVAGNSAHFAIAKPLYGTTLSHFSSLWSIWGPERTKAWHSEIRTAGVQIVNGNAVVRDLVASGSVGAGWTDSDDYFGAKEAGKSVLAKPVLMGDGLAICIPNTVAILKGASRPDHARKLADFLLSARTEVALANSKARQIPLGPLTDAQRASLPEEVREWLPSAERSIPLKDLLDARNECLDWLRAEYVK